MAFGKKNEESVGLLKGSIKQDGKTYTKYGTVQKDKNNKPSVCDLFRFASRTDVVLMFIGVVCSAIHGSSFPVLALVFGQMTNVFIKQARVSSTQSSNFVTSNYSTLELKDPNNSIDYTPPVGVIETASDFVQSYPFSFTGILSSNYTTAISPLNSKSPTLGAFFMSGMENPSTVKSVTHIHLQHNTNCNNLFNDSTLDPDEFHSYMVTFSLYYLYIGCGVLIAAFIQTFCWEMSCERQIYRLRQIFYRQILRQEISWFDLNGCGDLTKKLSGNMERIHEGIGSKFSMLTQYISTFFSGLIIGLYVNWRLTLLILCIAPFLIIVSGAIAMITSSTAAREQLKYALADGIAEEVISNMPTIAAFGGELRESKRYTLAVNKGRKLAMKKYYIFAVLMGSFFLILYLAYGIVFWYGSNLIVEGISSPGSIFTVFFSVMAGTFSVGNALPFLNSITVAIGAASTIFGIVDSKPYIDPYSSQGKKISKIQGKVEFKNVSFRYSTRYTVKVLNNLSLLIEPGQTIAFVGSCGSGKTTIGNLLLRFYDPSEGQILVDNFNLKDLNLHWLRSNIGIVSQEPVLFGVSIAENIRYGQSDCTQLDIIAAAMTANAHSFIIKLPKGYDTLVGDKVPQLSDSEKQRIAIARVLAKDPKILVLDEATSVVGASSEKIVQNALEKAQKNRTTIIIAQELAKIKHVDVIYVLQNGTIVESGTHSGLMEKNGMYSNLVSTQTKQEEKGNDKYNKESDKVIKELDDIDNITESEFVSTNELFSKHSSKKKQTRLKDSFVKPCYKAENIEAFEHTKIQTTYDEDRREIKSKTNLIVEQVIEPEKVFTDSFITDDIDGNKVNVTRQVSSCKVKRIIYTDQDSSDSELDKSSTHCSVYSKQNCRQSSQIDNYSQCMTSDFEHINDLNQVSVYSASPKKGYQFIGKDEDMIPVKSEDFGVIDLLKLNCPEWPWLTIGFIGCALTGAIMPVFALFYGQVFSTFTLKCDALLQEAAFWSKMFVVFALISGFAWHMQTIGLTYSCENLIMRMRVQAFENIVRQPVFWFELKNSLPINIINRLARDGPLVKSAGGLRIGQVISVFVTLSVALVIAFTFGWKLAIVLIFGVPIIAGAAYKQLKMVRRKQKQDTECMIKADRIVSETIASIKTVQGLGQELMFVTKYENSLIDIYKAAKNQAVTYAITYAITQAVIYVMYSVAFRYGAYLVEVGDMSAINIYRVFFALAFCASSVGQSSALFQDYARAKYGAATIFQLIRRKSEIDPLSKSGSKPEIKGKVRFRDVEFKYPSQPNVCVLRDLNFVIEPGKTLAIVGESGCGKSTILSLVERFYDPSRGVIEVDNHDTRAMNLHHLRKHIGIVTQEPLLFNCSIKDNIAYGINDREVTIDEIIDVAKKSNIHDFIITLPQRYDTWVGDRGCQLSGGQKQRVAIARALIRNPKILLLDEHSLALDTKSEADVQETLEIARNGRTCIIITYRLSTIQSADTIAVIHNGKIVEQGSHQELKAKKKYYYQLFKHQEKMLSSV